MEENKHIPKYIRDKPWYVESGDDDADYLGHHRREPGEGAQDFSVAQQGSVISDRFVAGSAPRAGRGRGRCTNCGANHDRRDCLLRPRKQARGDGGERAFQVRDENALSFEAKRDRWYGFEGPVAPAVAAAAAEPPAAAEDAAAAVERYKLGLDARAARAGVGAPAIRPRHDRARYLDDVRGEETRYDPKSRVYRGDGAAGEAPAAPDRAGRDGSTVDHVISANPTRLELGRQTPERGARQPEGQAQSAAARASLLQRYGNSARSRR
ncbi:AGR159Cp [Eremothecium gossypii ATCC 10895]|uniref:Pre-mRNA-splicing factor SLU7 n=1 Tax=Eremothecium gossypii (strain ATCC 10895 / CBS 109.51 / FGSC 9923 / NRRL Y-1056) TaxID=284811 RepID=SLU7_EREGS|nr:AGR159Cp [Eremothecium gossypii ATCC 10895]Q74ZN9.1 RecName: Full=Pre-mRNA-splicing factor SLU7 [Eremothecium gossypii ATCC 10895]AAS54649.1 AGR159Cp [Eremothecium gossypii ATCC 10895]AEY98979.1 FAGR159Cp [Eremothecium gossypii FDAG1]